jgi:hypothetical protein
LLDLDKNVFLFCEDVEVDRLEAVLDIVADFVFCTESNFLHMNIKDIQWI